MSAPARLVESFARHLMVQIDAWQEDGFGAVAQDYLARLPPREGRAPRHRRERRSAGAARRQDRRRAARRLLPRSQAPSWLDPQTRRAAPMKLLRTIRLDPSDTFVFERAAEPGEWAVSGAFVFCERRSRRRSKARRARRSAPAFSASHSLGWSTLVQIVEASDGDRAAAVEALAQQLVDAFRRARSRDGARRGRGGSRVRGLALRPSRRHADRGASHA